MLLSFLMASSISVSVRDGCNLSKSVRIPSASSYRNRSLDFSNSTSICVKSAANLMKRFTHMVSEEERSLALPAADLLRCARIES